MVLNKANQACCIIGWEDKPNGGGPLGIESDHIQHGIQTLAAACKYKPQSVL